MNVILISGASRGIGRSIAEKLLQDGYYLSLGVREPNYLQNTVFANHERVLIQTYEAKDKQSPIDWVKATIDKFGRLDGVINCAGILERIQFEDDNEEGLDRLFEVNVKAPWRLTREAFPYLKQSGKGRIINLVSMSGKRVKGTLAGYSMSKFAFLALSQSMRNAGWEDGIRVTAICPSFVNTDMAKGVKLDSETITQPEDVADIVKTILKLPNTAYVGEVLINFALEK
ncbi:MAG: SDR family NAD(P)-dependent oxidoreductase [Geminocystis sp.]|uniref:SDR family NAD(P)-dependent oxidoreductase n=1 Tax=Cyanobacterium aponinum 0216 TaxID=2676140 RepID=A0A844GTI5_9CHRO|nr:SDR family NAD(P)-dependent oxidoreductase [Cyanobacterium aponinum]MTF39330.1 SDR family NAD(P)-dependent oxidoreductase [Cyanobacterium aponinum 0216]